MWNSLHDLWNALLFDEEYILNYIDKLVLALNKEDINEIENIANDIRAENISIEN